MSTDGLCELGKRHVGLSFESELDFFCAHFALHGLASTFLYVFRVNMIQFARDRKQFRERDVGSTIRQVYKVNNRINNLRFLSMCRYGPLVACVRARYRVK